MMPIQIDLKRHYENDNKVAKDILESYAKAEFFTQLPEIDEEIKHCYICCWRRRYFNRLTFTRWRRSL